MGIIGESTKYPLLLVHGIGYRDRGKELYWGRISRSYREAGATIYLGEQDAWGTVENNALTLKDTLDRIFSESGSTKVNIIAHSKGGLEARYLASALDCADRIASITTISTPHRGSKTMDFLMSFPKPLIKFVGIIVDGFFKMLGDKKPDFYLSCLQLSTKKMAEFNAEVPDADGIYYQSYTSVMRSPGSDIIMAIQNAVVSFFDGENDGLVSAESAKWGDFKGIWRGNTKRGISHADVVDMRRKAFSKVDGPGVKDIVDEYMKILAGLADAGL